MEHHPATKIMGRSYRSRLVYTPLISVIMLMGAVVHGAPDMAEVKSRLTSDFHEKLYGRTYQSLLGRVEPDGFFEESLTGEYRGMFPRTIGALVSLFLETDELDKSENLLNCTLQSMTDNHMERIPHVLDRRGAGEKAGPGKTVNATGIYLILSDRDQIDGQAHILMAWARLANRRGNTAFEERTWPQVATLMDRSTDWPYVRPEIGLVQNFSFEHSREGRMWETYDLLTQHFMGAALEEMIKVAQRRGDTHHVALWGARLNLLKTAINTSMTRMVDNRKIYLEMRLPDSNMGKPFNGMGWVILSPIAAQWQGLDLAVMRDTMAYYRSIGSYSWNGLKLLSFETYEDNTFSKFTIGKGLGWAIDYSRQEHETGELVQWLDYLKAANHADLIMEAGWLNGDDTWRLKDAGNGEQAAWWCWAMARLRKEAGLPARPTMMAEPLAGARH